MLYQLSYASTAKPTECITAAIKLQAGLPARQHNHCHHSIYYNPLTR